MRKTIAIGISIIAIMLLSTGVIAINKAPQIKATGFNPNEEENYLETLKTLKNYIPDLGEIYAGEEPTEWTPDGGFVGVWAVKNNGNCIVLGYIAGYYKGNLNRGSYAGIWNTTDNNYTGYLGGLYRRFYTIGRVNLTGNQTRIPFIGFLLKNTTHFAGRLIGPVGPIIYVYGRHMPLNTNIQPNTSPNSSTNQNTNTQITNSYRQLQARNKVQCQKNAEKTK